MTDVTEFEWECSECAGVAVMFVNGTTLCRSCKITVDERARAEREEWEAHVTKIRANTPAPVPDKLPMAELRTAIQMIISSLEKNGVSVPVQLQEIHLSVEDGDD